MRLCRYKGWVVAAPQIRFHGFWRYINVCVCMYVCTLCMSRDHKAQENRRAAEAPPRTTLWELTALPKPSCYTGARNFPSACRRQS